MNTMKLFLFLFTGLLIMASCGEKGKYLHADDYGEEWPLMATDCYVRCVGDYAIVANIDGEDYAVNAAAKKMDQFKEIKPMQKDNPNYPGEQEKMSLSDIEFEGLKLCD